MNEKNHFDQPHIESSRYRYHLDNNINYTLTNQRWALDYTRIKILHKNHEMVDNGNYFDLHLPRFFLYHPGLDILISKI